tara:strand:+ start:5099 stop:5806 length:708 start_codon:yes stop_codon:yes gene_type:complete
VLYATFEIGRHFPSSGTVVAHLQDDPTVLLDHPELISAAHQLAKNQREHKNRERRASVIAFQETFLLESPLATMVDNGKAPFVDIVEFLDYQCEPCKASYAVVQRAQDNNPHLRVVYQMLPVYGSGSELAARMALAAQLQGKFEPFHRHVMKSDTALNPSVLAAIAEGVGLDKAQLETDMFSDQVRHHIGKTKALAEQLNVTGVPSFIVSGQLLTGGLTDDLLQAAIESGGNPPL